MFPLMWISLSPVSAEASSWFLVAVSFEWQCGYPLRP